MPKETPSEEDRPARPGSFWIEVQVMFWIAFAALGYYTTNHHRLEPGLEDATLETAGWPPPPPVRGRLRVLDEDSGALLAGATVKRLEEHPEERSSTYLDPPPGAKDGEFLYAGPGGIVEFAVEAPGHEGSFPRGFPVEIPAEGTFTEEFRLPRGGALRLRFECDGNPVSPQSVNIHVPSGTSGLISRGIAVRDGVGELDGLPRGDYGVVVDRDGRYVLETAHGVRVECGETTEDTVLLQRRVPGPSADRDATNREIESVPRGPATTDTVPNSPVAAIRVLLRCNGKPLQRPEAGAALFRDERLGEKQGSSTTRWLNGSSGLLWLRGLPPVTYVLRVQDRDLRFEPVPEREVTLLSGETRDFVVDLVRRE